MLIEFTSASMRGQSFAGHFDLEARGRKGASKL
jgi:hypothetical protein